MRFHRSSSALAGDADSIAVVSPWDRTSATQESQVARCSSTMARSSSSSASRA
jgi:hypothetical protein